MLQLPRHHEETINENMVRTGGLYMLQLSCNLLAVERNFSVENQDQRGGAGL
jgi:hypothetical protein